MPQYPRTDRIAIIASLTAATLVGVFILGMHFGSSSSPPSPAPAVTSSDGATPEAAPAHANNTATSALSRDAQRHLDAAESLVAQALASFQAVAADTGEAGDKAFNQAKVIAQDIADAQAYLQTHPDFTPQTDLRTIPSFATAFSQQTVALRPGVDNLGAALVEIQKIPHGLGGAREKTVADITQISSLLPATVRINPQPPVAQPVPLTPEAVKALLVPTPTPTRFQPLRFTASPADLADFVLTTLKQGQADLANATLADLSPPLRAFTFSSAQLSSDRGLEAASNIDGFSYFADANGKTVVRALVRLNPNTGKPQSFSRTVFPVNPAPTVKYLADVEPALIQLTKVDAIKSGSYEPRLLTVNASSVIQALWLTSDKGAPDLIFILSAASADLPVQKLIPASEFITLARAARPTPPVGAAGPLVAIDVPARFQPLRFAPSPANGADLFLTTAKRNNTSAVPELAAATVADVLPPLREFSPNPGQIIAGLSLADASTQVGFCYLLGRVGKAIERGNLLTNNAGLGQTMTVGIANASNLDYFLEIEPALLHLVTLDQIKTGSYEPRLISFNSPPFQVLWLSSDKAAPELIYTLNTDTLAIANHKLMAADDFVKLLQPILKNPPPPGQPNAEVLKAALAPTSVPPSLQALHFAPSPIGGASAALAAAQRLSNTSLPDIGGATVADISTPIRYFTLDPAEIADDKGLESAREVAFAYLLDSEGKSIARVDIRINAAGKPTLQGVASSLKYLAQINPALEHLASLDQIKSGAYEPRLLVAPNFQAIWLTSDKPSPAPPDLIYTLSAAAPSLPAQKLSTADDFLKTLRPIYKQQLQPPAPPGG